MSKLVALRGMKIFFLAVNTGFVKDGTPDKRCMEFYGARSGHGLYCSIVGNVVVPGGSGSNDVCAEISSRSEWSLLAKSIKEKGAKAGIQLSSTWQSYSGMKKFVPKNQSEAVGFYKEQAAKIDRAAIEEAFSRLDSATRLALLHGFDHIQLHAAHGYLFNLMIDPRFSPHSQLAVDYFCAWVKSLSRMGGESSIRISMRTGDKGLDEGLNSSLLEGVLSSDVDYVDISEGFYNINKKLIYPSVERVLDDRKDFTLEVAERFPLKSIIASGRAARIINSPVPENVHVGLCRDLIANPDFLLDQSIGCDYCMKCHYYSRGRNHIDCGKWN
ncbi:hypothetical protein M5C97_21965 [Acidovorax sp. NCPPB 3859]|nr:MULTISPECIES: hypothetical protein [unclassified Acidovorax]MDA8452294.1 hypothetical protein [Acidovorax sp. GBBC 3297]MDA8461740.1 hypothetical protein [Acidovorax sp. GBBC 3333]MDA8466773.1 hypothetical protein [Acidovorax sp. GBBC 3332]MDA8471813.1 hypothetical protein [Acidovorax sp. GBBC 3299]WCM78135.1 hypothetical protein M5C94_21910 [Acidovorax sp. GBBC 712]